MNITSSSFCHVSHSYVCNLSRFQYRSIQTYFSIWKGNNEWFDVIPSFIYTLLSKNWTLPFLKSSIEKASKQPRTSPCNTKNSQNVNYKLFATCLIISCDSRSCVNYAIKNIFGFAIKIDLKLFFSNTEKQYWFLLFLSYL